MRTHLRCPIALLLVLGLPLLVSCGSGGGATAPATTPGPTAPANPTGFVLVASSASGLSLKWDAAAGATTYTLERKSGSAAYAKVTDTSATTFDDSGLAADTDYAYRLKVVNAAGSSSGVELNARTAKAPSPAPTLTGFSPASGAVGTVVTLTGTNLSGATGVSFNGVAAATLTNITASSLQATVPTGASTGKITVTTPGGTATSSASFNLTGNAGIPQVGAWKERILNADGSINWTEWEYVANHYHTAEILDWRLGPRHTDYHPGAGDAGFPTVYQPEPNGLWKGGVDRALADKFCVTSDKLPKSEAEEKALYDGGGAWMMSGQMLFVPDANAPKEFSAGCANMRNFDGAMARKLNAQGQLETKALCMRLRAEWYGDWWNRNNISTPETPAIGRLKQQSPTLPLPPIATTRGEIQASIAGFLAFQNGWIIASGTGNDPYTGFGTPLDYPALQLPAGKVPTALALSAMNEFLFATVWDVKAHKGQLAVIAVGPDDPANIGPAATGRYGWGAQSWPVVRGLKLLGFVDLPMAAPTSLSVSLSTGTMKFRGFNTWYEDLNQQSVRDAWFNRAWDDGYDTTMWKLLASAGYAVVASRAENKVAFVDLRPLLSYYRKMYLTTQANWDQTANAKQGLGDAQWPYTFTFAPEQIPTILSVQTVPQPTAVHASKRASGTNGRAGWEIPGGWNERYKHAWVASMDGSLRQFNVESLGNPGQKPTAPTVLRTLQVGPNPTCVTTTIAGDAANDDLFVVSRGSREVRVFDYKGSPLATLRDARMKDPVFVASGPDGGGYGGSGKDYALAARVLTVLDYDGKTVHDYGMYIDNYPAKQQPGRLDSWYVEQWPYLSPDGKSIQPFQYGFGNPLAGKPFMFSFDEVI